MMTMLSRITSTPDFRVPVSTADGKGHHCATRHPRQTRPSASAIIHIRRANSSSIRSHPKSTDSLPFTTRHPNLQHAHAHLPTTPRAQRQHGPDLVASNSRSRVSARRPLAITATLLLHCHCAASNLLNMPPRPQSRTRRLNATGVIPTNGITDHGPCWSSGHQRPSADQCQPRVCSSPTRPVDRCRRRSNECQCSVLEFGSRPCVS